MMKAPSWMVGRRTSSRDMSVADQKMRERLDGIGRSLRRRLSDKIEALFQESCLSGDLETAESLLTILERMSTRPTDGPDKRRVPVATLERLRAELEQSRTKDEPIETD